MIVLEEQFKQVWVWVTYGILFIVTVPWYWPTESDTFVWGLPVWCLVTVIGCFVTAVFTTCLLSRAIKNND